MMQIASPNLSLEFLTKLAYLRVRLCELIAHSRKLKLSAVFNFKEQ